LIKNRNKIGVRGRGVESVKFNHSSPNSTLTTSLWKFRSQQVS